MTTKPQLDPAKIEEIRQRIFNRMKLNTNIAARNPLLVAALDPNAEGTSSVGACGGSFLLAEALNEAALEAGCEGGFTVIAVIDNDPELRSKFVAGPVGDAAYAMVREHLVVTGPDGKIYEVTPANEDNFEIMSPTQQTEAIQRILSQHGGGTAIMNKLLGVAKGWLSNLNEYQKRLSGLFDTFEEAAPEAASRAIRYAQPTLAPT